jgi:preprotein translocase subunit Sec61beta
MTDGKTPKAASPLQVAKAVLWSFLGIRRRAEHESDATQLKPAQVVVAGLIGAAILVLSLVLLVKFIVGRAA